MRRPWTRVLVVSACIAFALGLAASPAHAQEAIFFVRHAERLDDSADSPLSAEGRARAARLAETLRDARITAIFVTEFQRTRDTGKPLADRLGLPLKQISALDPATLVTTIRALGPQARVLVVGHSDTLPLLLDVFGVTEVKKIAKEEYDNLFVVLPSGKGAPVFLRLRS
jgi:broad specificity phosphatase PhoE